VSDPYHYRGYLIYSRHYCGQVFEVFVNHLSIGLTHQPHDYAQRFIDSKTGGSLYTQRCQMIEEHGRLTSEEE
jgi:hypothetical protein